MRSERRPRAARRERKPRVTRLGRFVRGRRPDRNPLRRTCDRAETAVLAGLLAAFLAAAPFAALACGTAAHALARQEQQAQQASLRQVRAVLLKPASTTDTYAPYAALEPEVPARWTAPDGKAVTGQVPAPAGTAAGATVLVWAGQDGQLTGPPLQDAQVAGQTVLGEAFGVAALAGLLIITGVLARRALDKRRMAGWDADWQATGPRWTPRR
jgi:hypothetical protein